MTVLEHLCLHQVIILNNDLLLRAHCSFVDVELDIH